MIRRLTLQNCTVLPDADYAFSPGLNVVTGESGTGKSHLLTLLYVLATFAPRSSGRLSKTGLSAALEKSLLENFRTSDAAELLRRGSRAKSCGASWAFVAPDTPDASDAVVSFSVSARVGLSMKTCPKVPTPGAVFFPAQELISLCPWFAPACELYRLEFGRSWYDTCLVLQAPGRKDGRPEPLEALTAELREALGGGLWMDPVGRFHLRTESSGLVRMALLGEGQRKLAMLLRLLETGVLEDRKVFFWDLPEAHLDAQQIPLVTKALRVLVRQGVQVFVSAHPGAFLSALMHGEVDLPEAGAERTRRFVLRGPDEGLECADEPSMPASPARS